jgi:hypothetical protein
MDLFRFGVRLSIAFFVVGTIILIVFYFTLSAKMALFAYQYTIMAILVNWMYAAMLLYYFLKQRILIETLLKTLGVMALNIPVGILYAYVMVWLLGYARITFKNTTGTDLDLIRIEGCQEKEIANLKKDDSRTVWISIPEGCSVHITYELDGEQKKETVVGYLVPDGGIKTTFEIKKE